MNSNNQQIHTIHGIVKEHKPELQTHRNYISEESYSNYLNNLKEKYVKWDRDNTCNVLTIDDSTIAGATACIKAVEKGHHVIFFVNPYQIANKKKYFFSYLDAILDFRKTDKITFQNVAYDLQKSLELKRFRKKIKQETMVLTPDLATSYLLDEIKPILGSDDYILQSFLDPIKVEDLISLKKMGVQIESHGWSHINISAFTEPELKQDLLETTDWFQEQINQSPSLYAVPFGYPDVPIEIASLFNSYFLLEDILPVGQIAPNGWNRIDITSHIVENY